jgi:hypothetical protein
MMRAEPTQAQMNTIDNLAYACYIPRPKEVMDEENADEAACAFTGPDSAGRRPASHRGFVARYGIPGPGIRSTGPGEYLIVELHYNECLVDDGCA